MARKRIYKRDKYGRFDDVNGPGANAGKTVSVRQGGLGQHDAGAAAAMRSSFEAKVRAHNAAKAKAGGIVALTGEQMRAKQAKRLARLNEANRSAKGASSAAIKGRKLKK